MIDQHWRGRVYTFRNERGQDFVSPYPPQGKPPRPLVMAYAASGPYRPIHDREPAHVDDVSKWMARMNALGFVFVLVDSGVDLPVPRELMEA
jgi:hypothetical protein